MFTSHNLNQAKEQLKIQKTKEKRMNETAKCYVIPINEYEHMVNSLTKCMFMLDTMIIRDIIVHEQRESPESNRHQSTISPNPLNEDLIGLF